MQSPARHGFEAMNLGDMRADFERRSRRSLSLPIAGCIVWAAIAVVGLLVPQRMGILMLMFATGAIFPLALFIARQRGEQLLSNANPLARLMGACVLMVNLLWALHIPLWMRAPAFVPLSIGIGLGLHWVVYSWITRHPLGYLHATMRSLLLFAAWLTFPQHVVTACAVVVVFSYAVALQAMAERPILQLPPEQG